MYNSVDVVLANTEDATDDGRGTDKQDEASSYTTLVYDGSWIFLYCQTALCGCCTTDSGLSGISTTPPHTSVIVPI